MKDLAEVKVEYPDLKVTEQQQGNQLVNAPAKSITVDTGTPITNNGAFAINAGDAATLTQMRQRITDLENALIKLGLLRHP